MSAKEFKRITVPISDEAIRDLRIGDSVLLSGVIVTGRDTVHKWFMDSFITKTVPVAAEDAQVYEELKKLLQDGVIYHCGPVVSGLQDKNYRFVAAGPTTSIREEAYQGQVMEHFHMKGVIGKGGMGAKTLAACAKIPGVYFHAIGGAASLIAESVKKVLGVYKLEFGVPEALWVIQVEDFPVVVTMDSHGNSLHDEIQKHSLEKLQAVLAK
ncbi:MAG TPA: FumA C-terminus/TtdB family hydratase beta subunit [Anaerolineaceae bacterium]|jgi:fumarate hydratase class I|nr:FumA C-terminus/TtdB family hydratase beta subunit [Anaerolineaceae bacterium]